MSDEAEEVSAVQPDGTHDAFVVTIASATGGCGKTFFATSFADIVGRQGHKTLVVDLDLQFGEIAIALQLRPEYSLYDGLYGTHGEPLPAEAFEEHFDELIVHHEFGFDVLTAPRDPALADYVGAGDASHVLKVVRKRYDIVIVDTPPALTEIVLSSLDQSDVVAVMASLDVPSLKNLKTFTDTLLRLQIGHDAQRLILNKVDDDLGLDLKEVHEAFEGRFVAEIPMSKSVSRAMNVGTVVTEVEPEGKVSQELMKAARAILPEHLAPKQEGEGTSFLTRLLRGTRKEAKSS